MELASVERETSQRCYTQPKQLLAISALWLGFGFFWSALLPIWIPSKVADFAGDAAKGTYSFYIFAAGAVVSTIIQLVIGPISDHCRHRWGRRRPFILWGIVLSLPGALIFAGAPTFVVLVFGFVWVQIFLNIATGPYQAILPDLVPEEKHGMASAYMGVATIVGNGLALLLAGLLIGGVLLPAWTEQNRLWLLMAAMIVVLLATMIWTLLGTRERPLQKQEYSRLRLKDILDLNLKGERNFAFLIASRFFLNMGFYTATTYFVYYLSDSIGLGQTAAERAAGPLFVVVTFAGLLGNWPAGKLADRMSKKKVLYFTCVILSVAVVLFLLAPTLKWVWAISVIFGIAWGAFYAVDWALAASLVPMEQAGRYMAIWHLAFTLPQVVAPGFGPLADRINAQYGHGLGWRAAFACILIYVLLGVFCLRFIEEKPTISSA